MPSQQTPFVSFNDYLNANAGSLDSERSSQLAKGQAAVDTAVADVQPVKDAAYAQGADAAKAAWSAQRAGGGVTSSKQYVAPDAAQLNYSTLPGQEKLNTDAATASALLQSNTQGGLGQGKGAFEAGMLGADASYGEKARGMQKSFQDQVNGYLDSLKAAGLAGVQSFHPAPIQTTQVEGDPRTAPTTLPDGSTVEGEGPTMKPRTIRKRYEDGEPVP